MKGALQNSMLQPLEALHDPENPQQVMEASVHQAYGLLFSKAAKVEGHFCRETLAENSGLPRVTLDP